MKKIAVAALTAAFALAACGTAATPAPTTDATITPIPSSKTATPATAAPATAAASAAKTAAPAATTAASAPAASSAPAGNAAARKVEVGATNTNYSIATLDVKPGEKIEFVLTNSGDEKHNLVGVGEGISLVSPDFDSGSTVSWVWTAPTKLGTFKLQCSYHTTIPPIVVTVKQ